MTHSEAIRLLKLRVTRMLLPDSGPLRPARAHWLPASRALQPASAARPPSFGTRLPLAAAALLATALLSAPASLKAQQAEERTLRAEVDLREGPGSFFDMIARLNEGAELRTTGDEEGWLEVRFRDYEGWIPDQPDYFRETHEPGEEEQLEAEERMREVYTGLLEAEADTAGEYATPTQVAAAVRGFTERYTAERLDEEPGELDALLDMQVDPEEFERFRRLRQDDWSRSMADERFELTDEDAPAFSKKYESMGWGIAARLANEKGVLKEEDLQTYVQYIGMMLGDSSHRYEVPYRVHIIEQDQVVGYSTPNGVLFISQGALEMMESEAELAFFIAHEIAHVVMQHGVQETDHREIRARRDRAFDALRRAFDHHETEKDHDELAQELTRWADQVYEYLISERLEAYEYQADFWGLVYMMRSGYDPSAAANLLHRIHEREGDFERQVGSLEWRGATLESRIEHIQGHIRDARQADLIDERMLRYEQQFQQMMDLVELQ